MDTTPDGNIIIGQEEQAKLRKAHSQIQNQFTILVYKLGKMEIENLKLKMMKETKQTAHKKKSFAEAVVSKDDQTVHHQEEEDGRQHTGMDYEIWTTPPTKKRHETVIRFNGIDNSKDTL